MVAPRKFDLDQRLEAYFATLRSPSLKQALKRSAANWQLYATVTGSAMAMLTNASAAMIGNGAPDAAAEPTESAQTAQQLFASSRNPPVVNAIRRSMADGKTPRASQAQAQPPSILPGGVVPLYSTVGIIQPGEWISIYGTNLAGGNFTWNGDFPTSLGGASVEINGKPGYLEFVSPSLINLQAPDDTATGTVSVVVTTPGGKATSTVTLAPYSPSFSVLDGKYVSGIILRSNGAYDILGPTGTSFGYPTVAAKPGDTVVLYAVGFGPTTPAVPAGQPFSGAATVNDAVNLYINNVLVKPTFIGLSSASLYQINLKVPSGLGQGDVLIKATIGSARTQADILFSLRNTVAGGGTGTGGTGGIGGGGGGGGTGFGSSFGGGGGGGGGTGGGGGGTGGGGGGGGTGGGGGGTGGGGGGSGGGTGGGGGGSGGGSVAAPPGSKPYHPRLRFTPEG